MDIRLEEGGSIMKDGSFEIFLTAKKPIRKDLIYCKQSVWIQKEVHQ